MSAATLYSAGAPIRRRGDLPRSDPKPRIAPCRPATPSRVLYTGDHIDADMRDPRRFGWRTAMILSEMGNDVEVQNSESYRVALTRILEAKDFVSNVFSVRRSPV